MLYSLLAMNRKAAPPTSFVKDLRISLILSDVKMTGASEVQSETKKPSV